MEKIFQRLATAFGSHWTSKWQGLDLDIVMDDWADDLNDMSIGQIKHAIEICRNKPMPPNLFEFKDACRVYSPNKNSNLFAIGRKRTEEEREIAKKFMAEINKRINRGTHD